jgi:hypothetical protein
VSRLVLGVTVRYTCEGCGWKWSLEAAGGGVHHKFKNAECRVLVPAFASPCCGESAGEPRYIAGSRG